MSLCFVCAPLQATPTRTQAQHTADAHAFARYLTREHRLPVYLPHWLAAFTDDSIPEERALGRTLALQVLEACSAIAVLGPRVSEGMAAEVAWAVADRMRIRVFEALALPFGEGYAYRELPRDAVAEWLAGNGVTVATT